MAEKLEGSNHGKAAVVELLVGLLVQILGSQLLSSTVTELEETPVVNSTDGEEHLEPAKSWDGLNSLNTVRDRGEGDARGDLARPAEDLDMTRIKGQGGHDIINNNFKL